MTCEEYLERLNETFKDFKFFPEDHHYEYKGEHIGISVTKLIEEYSQEFDKESVARRVANKKGVSVKEILDEWEYKNEFSKAKGTTCHEYAQSLWNGKVWNPKVIYTEEYLNAVEKIQEQANDFYWDYCNKLEHLADEFIIGSKEYDVASAVDHLFVDKETHGLVLVDYKTNSDIFKNAKYAGLMKSPLQHLKDTTINHYFLQLSIYKWLIETYSGLEIEDMFIVWFSEMNGNYQTIDVPYLKEEVENIMNWRLLE